MNMLRAERPAGARRFMLCLLVLTACVSIAHAEDINARIYKKGVANPFQGKARWLKASKVYKITIPPNQELTIPIDQVDKTRGVNGVQAIEPKELTPAIKMVMSERYATAIPVLVKIKDDYTMFQWDVPAARWLAEAYMGTKNWDKAYAEVLDMKKENPDALLAADFFKVYCQILIEKKLHTEVLKAIEDQLAYGESRETKAVAQLMRGAMQMNKGDYKGALIDGYLRTMYFFQDIKAVQPEAMLGAIQCLKKLGDVGKEDKVRKMLLEKYPSSKEALTAQAQ